MTLKFIQNGIKHKGGLHKQLGISLKQKIPSQLIERIMHAHPGQRIRNPTGIGKYRIHVTALLERRVNLAHTLRGFRR